MTMIDAGALAGGMRTVLVVITTASAYGRAVLRGVVRYCGERPGVEIVHVGSAEALPARPMRPLDGVLSVGGFNPATARRLKAMKAPVVLLNRSDPEWGLPMVHSDGKAVGSLAAKYLSGLGYRQFAFCGGPLWAFSSDRERAFAESLGDGVALHRFTATPVLARQFTPLRFLDEVARWLGELPRPIGIFAPSDEIAYHVSLGARRAGIHLPGEAALLSVDNDELICEMSNPRLTSIDQGVEQIGFSAMRTLDEMMRGERAPSRPIVVPPVRIVVRQSTDVARAVDPNVTEAVRFIRENFSKPILVDDILDRLTISRSSLQRAFRSATGRTLHEELTRTRVEHAKRLLLETELNLLEIADRCGFSYASQLSALFKKETGVPPSEFRRSRGVLAPGPG